MARLTVPLKAEKMQLPLDRMFPSPYKMEGKEACLYCQYSMELLHSLLNINGTKVNIKLTLSAMLLITLVTLIFFIY